MFSINPSYNNEKFIHSFNECFQSKSPNTFQQGGCQLLKLPFSCAQFSEFIDLRDAHSEIKNTDELLNAVEKQTRMLPFNHRSNDLFKFNQSVDVVNLELDKKNLAEDVTLLMSFRQFLISDILPWLERITGTKLDKEKVDLTSSIYKSTDVLLCHDDELEGRRIAFIWYLVPEDWDAAKDGGYLQLFSCQTEDQANYYPDPHNPAPQINPWTMSTLLAPHRNMFAFFEVSAYSFHQVTEILGNKERISLHGWFHGPPLPRPAEREHPTRIPRITPMQVEEDLVYRWINPLYIDMAQQAKIRRRFIRASEIQLVNFLKADQWTELITALTTLNDEKLWSHVGPYNRKNFCALTRDSFNSKDELPDVLRQLYRLFTSEAMLVILSDLTGIRFHPSSAMLDIKTPEVDTDAPEAKRIRMEYDNSTIAAHSTTSECASLTEPQLRRWRTGCYTLLADTELIGGNWRLESVLHVAGYGKSVKQSTKQSDTSDKAPEPVSSCWDAAWGGQIIYVAKDEKDDLLRVHPVDNALTLVYIGPDTTSFVKYINHMAKPIAVPAPDARGVNGKAAGDGPATSAYDLAITYYEPVSDSQSEGRGSSIAGNDATSMSGDESNNDDEDDFDEDEASDDDEQIDVGSAADEEERDVDSQTDASVNKPAP